MRKFAILFHKDYALSYLKETINLYHPKMEEIMLVETLPTRFYLKHYKSIIER